MAGNKNHPPKHSIIKVQGIERRKERERIEQNLAGQPRDRCLFVTGCNTAFRASELTGLKVGQVRGARAGFKLVIREQKTSKIREVVLNRKVCDALDAWLSDHPWAVDDDAPLFPNLRTGRPLTVSTVSKYVKRWCRQAGLKGNYASHSLRKSFGYSQRVDHGVSLSVLTRLFGHSTERQTMTYLCIDDAELDACYLHEV